jgi:hypothetical protein
MYTTPTPSSSSSSWRPSIASRVCGHWQLLKALAVGDVALLCEALCEPAWHVGPEVTRLQTWLNLSFHFR